MDEGDSLAAYYATAMAVDMDDETAAAVEEAQYRQAIDVSLREARVGAEWRPGEEDEEDEEGAEYEDPDVRNSQAIVEALEIENARKRREEEQRDWNFAKQLEWAQNHANQQPWTSGAGPSGIHPTSQRWAGVPAGPSPREEQERRLKEAVAKANAQPPPQVSAIMEASRQYMAEEQQRQDEAALADAQAHLPRPAVPAAAPTGPPHVLIDGLNVLKHRFNFTGVVNGDQLMGAMGYLVDKKFHVTAIVQDYVLRPGRHQTTQAERIRAFSRPKPPGYAGPNVEIATSHKEGDDLLALHRARRLGVKIVTNDRFKNFIGWEICEYRLTQEWVNENVCGFDIEDGHFYVKNVDKLRKPYRRV